MTQVNAKALTEILTVCDKFVLKSRVFKNLTKLEKRGNTLFVTTTNLSGYIVFQLETSDLDPLPAVTVNARDVLTVVRGHAQTHLSVVDSALVLQTETGRSTVLCGDPEAFPEPLDLTSSKLLGSLPGPALSSALAYTVPVTSTDASRAQLHATQLQVVNSVLKVCATDGHRAHMFDQPLCCPDLDILVPKACASALLKMLSKFSGTCSTLDIGKLVDKNNNPFTCFSGRFSSMSKNHKDIGYTVKFDLVFSDPCTGFPDARSCVPTEYETRFVVTRRALVDALKAASETAVPDEYKYKVVQVAYADHELLISTPGFSTRLPVRTLLPAELTMRFNVKYLLDALDVDDPEIMISAQYEFDPLVVTASDHTALVMPVCK